MMSSPLRASRTSTPFVHTVLELVDKQQAVFGVDEGEGDAEEPIQPVTE